MTHSEYFNGGLRHINDELDRLLKLIAYAALSENQDIKRIANLQKQYHESVAVKNYIINTLKTFPEFNK